MNKKFKGIAIGFILLTILLLILSNLPGPNFSKANILTYTSTMTFTPPADRGFEAITLIDTGCFDWSYQKLAEIDSFELLKVLGRNIKGTWFMVRWPKFTTTCWVEASHVKPSNFTPVELFVIYELFPPLYTSTSTSEPIPSSTPSPTPTRTKSGSTFTIVTRTSTSTKADTIATTDTPTNAPATPLTPINTPATPPTPTNTPVTPPTPTKTPVTPPTPTNTPVTPPTPTNTPVTPPTPTNTPVTPPTPTNTPSGNRACNDNIDNDGDGFIDLADPQCKNKGDNDESK